MMLAAVYSLLRYLHDGQRRFNVFGFLSIFLLFLIRPTIGLSTLAAYTIFLFMIKKSRDKLDRPYAVKFLLTFSGILLSVILIYWVLTRNLASYVSLGDLAYWKFLRLSKVGAGCKALWGLTYATFFSNPIRASVAVLFAGAGILTFGAEKNYLWFFYSF